MTSIQCALVKDAKFEAKSGLDNIRRKILFLAVQMCVIKDAIEKLNLKHRRQKFVFAKISKCALVKDAKFLKYYS